MYAENAASGKFTIPKVKQIREKVIAQVRTFAHAHISLHCNPVTYSGMSVWMNGNAKYWSLNNLVGNTLLGIKGVYSYTEGRAVRGVYP